MFKEAKSGFGKVAKSPWLIGGVVIIGGVILYALVANGGGGSSGGSNTVVNTGPSEALQAANLQASTALQSQQIGSQTQLAIAGLQASAQRDETQASLLALQAQIQGQLAITDLTSGRELDAILATTQAQRDISSQQITSQTEMARLSAQTAIERDSIAANAMIAQSSLAAQTQLGLAAENAALQRYVVGEAANTQITLGRYAAETQVALGDQNSRTAMEMARQQSQAYQQMIVANAETQIALGGFQRDLGLAGYSAQENIASINANNARRSNRDSVIGGVVGSIIGLFSDYRLKENIEFVGFREDGLSNYSYNYAGDDARQIGVMAQEVALYYPNAVHQHGEFLTVDYEAIA